MAKRYPVYRHMRQKVGSGGGEPSPIMGAVGLMILICYLPGPAIVTIILIAIVALGLLCALS